MRLLLLHKIFKVFYLFVKEGDMHKYAIILISLLISLSYAKVIQKGTVRIQNSGNKPLPGVQISAQGSNQTNSDNKGLFRLELPNKIEGNSIDSLKVSRSGYEWTNQPSLQSIVADSNLPLNVIMAPAGEREKNEKKNRRIIEENLQKDFERKINEITKKENYEKSILQHKIDSLTKLLETQVANAPALADEYSRNNLDDESELFQQAFVLFQNGKIDSSIKRLENAKLIEQADGAKNKVELDKRIKRNPNWLLQLMKDLEFQAQMYSIKFEYEKASKCYEKLLQLDSNNINNNEKALQFYSETWKDYKKSEAISRHILFTMNQIPSEVRLEAAVTLGRLFNEIGSLDSSLLYFNIGYSIGDSLFQMGPSNLEVGRKLSIVCECLAAALEQQGSFSRAREYFDRSIIVAERIFKADTQNVYLRKNLIDKYYSFARFLLARGDYAASTEMTNKAMQLIEMPVPIKMPSSPEEVSASIGQVLENLPLAEKEYNDGPKDEKQTLDMLRMYLTVGNFFCNQDSLSLALSLYLKGIDIANGVSEKYAKHVAFNELFGSLALNVAILHIETSNYQNAFDYLTLYKKIIDNLIRKFPQSEEYKRSLVSYYEELAIVYQAQGKDSLAISKLIISKNIMEDVVQSNPSNESNIIALIILYDRIVDIYQNCNEFEKSLSYLTKELKFSKELFEKNKEDDDRKDRLASSYSRLGFYYLQTGKNVDALANLSTAINLRGFLRERPNLPDYYDRYANDLFLAGPVACKLNLIDTGIRYQQQAADLYDNLYSLTSDPTYSINSGYVYSNISQCDSTLSPSEKISYHQKAVDRFLLAKDKDSSIVKDLINNYGNISYSLLFTKQFASADSIAELALKLAQQNEIEKYTEWIKTNLAHALLFQGKYDEAVNIYVELKDKPYPNDTTKNYAAFLIQDFDDLGKSGITSPDVAKIRALLMPSMKKKPISKQ